MAALGPVLVLLSVPLMLRWVPPNRVYGFRVPSTLGHASVWYDANALCGRHMFALGLLMILLEFALPSAVLGPTLRMTALAGIVLIIAMDWRAANRWARDRASAESRTVV